eukprot:SAG31_NODE_1610_length_7751_cov_2.938447_9_plen_274_part_00
MRQAECTRLTAKLASAGTDAPKLQLSALPAVAKRLDELEYQLNTQTAGRDEAVTAQKELQRRNVELQITISHLESELEVLRRAGPGSVHSVPPSVPSSANAARTASVPGEQQVGAREAELAKMLEEVVTDIEHKETERLHWQKVAEQERMRADVAEKALVDVQNLVVGNEQYELVPSDRVEVDMGFGETFTGTIEQCVGLRGSALKVRFDVDDVVWTIDAEKHRVTRLPRGGSHVTAADRSFSKHGEAPSSTLSNTVPQSPRSILVNRSGQPS